MRMDITDTESYEDMDGNIVEYSRIPQALIDARNQCLFTEDEISRLMIAAGNVGRDWPTTIMIGIYTGFRLGDATSLKWSDIDFERKLICYEPSKTRKHHIIVHIPLHQTLARWLTDHRNTSEYVTPERIGKVGKSRFTDGDKTFSQLLSDAQVEAVTGKDKLSFHCFRHTFVSRLAQAGVA